MEFIIIFCLLYAFGFIVVFFGAAFVFILKGLVGIVGVTCIAIRKLVIFMKKTLQDMVS